MDPGVICGLSVVIVLAPFVAWAGYCQTMASRTKSTYDDSLRKLKHNPHNADLRQETLRLGRVYIEWARRASNTGKRNNFDELVLTNDIAAACAGAGNPRDAQIPMAQLADSVVTNKPRATIEARLSRLDALLAAGQITSAEHTARRAEILGEI